MAERGVNGASSATLNARFIKCAGCKVNVPKDDMVALGKCTVCGRAYEPVVLPGGDAIAVEFVAFGGVGDAAKAPSNASSSSPAAAAEAPAKPRRRRWVELQSRKGRTYYHNSETGEDRWDKPGDFDAEAVDDAFVPFKNDFVKKAVMLEQAKMEATKLGVPVELLTAAHQGEREAQDPLAAMTKQALSRADSVEKQQQQNGAGATPTAQRSVAAIDEGEEFDGDDGQQVAPSTADAKKDGCVVM
ncbi:hypothetical protein PybrP1_001434 [[Pythium] brassicae (nom. inval.)]|nr:hypothetical protein PybrP1_001434 [[Pythium] brassicae (nom. inval.)]